MRRSTGTKRAGRSKPKATARKTVRRSASINRQTVSEATGSLLTSSCRTCLARLNRRARTRLLLPAGSDSVDVRGPFMSSTPVDQRVEARPLMDVNRRCSRCATAATRSLTQRGTNQKCDRHSSRKDRVQTRSEKMRLTEQSTSRTGWAVRPAMTSATARSRRRGTPANSTHRSGAWNARQTELALPDVFRKLASSMNAQQSCCDPSMPLQYPL